MDITQIAHVASLPVAVGGYYAVRHIPWQHLRRGHGPATEAAEPIANHDEGDGYYRIKGVGEHIQPDEKPLLTFKHHAGRRRSGATPHSGRFSLEGVLPAGSLAIGNQKNKVARIVEALQGELDQHLGHQPKTLKDSQTIPARIRRAAVAEVHCSLRSVLVHIKLRRGTKAGEMSKLRPELVRAVMPIISTADDSQEEIESRIRILQSIPGTDHVGIELPRKSSATLGLRALLESPELAEAHQQMETVVPIGVDADGRPLFDDLAKLPHLLVAGATGGGKSVWLHQMLACWHWLYSPEQLRILVIDPKLMEGKYYSGSPLLLPPVETGGERIPYSPEGALAVLQYAMGQVEMRNAQIAESGASNLAGYNKNMRAAGKNTLPRIAVVYDEFGEHMLSAKKPLREAIEEHIARIGQLARASGVHIIPATQRPSVDVVTGLIKSQLPTRIAFSVQCGQDSRTILDAHGAETLPAMGAMIFARGSRFVRAQGAFIDPDKGQVAAVVAGAQRAAAELKGAAVRRPF